MDIRERDQRAIEAALRLYEREHSVLNADLSSTFLGNTTAFTNRGPSPAIWGDCDWTFIQEGVIDGTTYFNDYNRLSLAPTETTQIAWDDGKVFATASGTVAPVLQVNSVDVGFGVLGFQPDASAHSASFANAYESYKLSGDPTIDGELWFEARIAVSTNGVVTNRLGWMIGLAETSLWTLATGVPFTSNAGALDASAAFIGFNHLPAATTVIKTVYSDRATSFTEIGTNQGLLAANTFTKLGFRYAPAAKDATARMIRFYQDNVELGTAMTKTTLTATTNLKANSLGIIIASVGGSSTSSDKLFVDWVRCAQRTITA